MKKILLAVVAALAAVLSILSSNPASATRIMTPDPAYVNFAPVNDVSTNANSWWNRDSNDGSSNVFVWKSFPILCLYPTVQRDAFQTLYLYDASTTSALSTNSTKINNALHYTASIFAASAQRFLYNDTQAATWSMAPAITTVSGTGHCAPYIKAVAIPHATWVAGGGEVNNWLHNNGYNQSNRKYIGILQGNWPSTWASNFTASGGVTMVDYSQDSAIWNDPNPATNRTDGGADYSANIFIPMVDLNETAIAHEMIHSMGGESYYAPHSNHSPNAVTHVVDGSHPSDCNDIMCYGTYSGNHVAGETYTSCNGGGGRDEYRLDCGDNDYWSPLLQRYDGLNSKTAWMTNNWTVDKSSYLWGNESLSSSTNPAHALN